MRRIRIGTTARFSSAHFLKGYRGKCESLHGHNYTVECIVEGKKLNTLGMVMDFQNLKKTLEDVVKEFDHVNLNDLPAFKEKNPTVENIARVIYEKLKKKLKNFKGIQVKVWETEDSFVEYGDL